MRRSYGIAGLVVGLLGVVGFGAGHVRQTRVMDRYLSRNIVTSDVIDTAREIGSPGRVYNGLCLAAVAGGAVLATRKQD